MTHRCPHPLYLCYCQLDRLKPRFSMRIFWIAFIASGIVIAAVYYAVLCSLWGGR